MSHRYPLDFYLQKAAQNKGDYMPLITVRFNDIALFFLCNSEGLPQK